MNTTTFGEFITDVKARCFPFGTPENIDSVIDQLAIEAMILIQRYSDQYREGHKDVFENSANIFTGCGTSTISRPTGTIHRIVNRLKDDDDDDSEDSDYESDCDTFEYDIVDRDELELVSKDVRNVDLSTCRLMWGNAWVDKNKIVLSPTVRDGEQVEVEWSGVKRYFTDDDIIPDDPEFFAAVSAYVQMEVARKYDKDTEAFTMHRDDWGSKLAEIMQDGRETGNRYLPPKDEDMTPALTFAFFADHGLVSDMDDAEAVARLVHSWNPDIVVVGGDNNYPSGATSTLDEAWAPYMDDIRMSRLFPALGNHDMDTELGTPQTNFFSLPGNGRYYQFVRGPVEFFVINSDPREEDGNDSASDQADWLETALGSSKATWKVVVCHHAPYTSDSTHTPGYATVRWPFEAWGADVVLSGHGHNYERILVSEFPYFVVGTGGTTLRAFTLPAVSGSQLRYYAKHGALRVLADKKKMLFKFYNIDGDMIDVYAITK